MAANDKPDEQVPEEEQNTTVSESEETVDIPVPAEDPAADSFKDRLDVSKPRISDLRRQNSHPLKNSMIRRRPSLVCGPLLFRLRE